MFVIGVPDQTEPQAGVVQITADLFGEALPFFVRSHHMEAATVEHEPEWRSLSVALEEVQHDECTCGIRSARFLFGLLYRNLRRINPDDIEVLFREPNCVIASPAADVQSVTRSDGQAGHGLDEVEVRLANVPRCGACFVVFIETIFGCHRTKNLNTQTAPNGGSMALERRNPGHAATTVAAAVVVVRSGGKPVKPTKTIPPLYFLSLLLVSIVLGVYLPVRRLIYFPYAYICIVPIAIGVVLNLWADSQFKKNKTPVKPYLKPTALMTSGVFRITRNPMYLGMTLILFGVSILVGSLTAFVSSVAFFFISESRFIPPEENTMENLFGESYLEYMRRVRRWI
jgi:protein-S-isoprenylcysteine O-methyltransferase Ste14